MSQSTTSTPTVVAQALGSLAHFERAARRRAGAWNGAPVHLVPGGRAPVISEKGGYYTRGGERIRHPGAYRWTSGLEYRYQAVEVGADWAPSSW